MKYTKCRFYETLLSQWAHKYKHSYNIKILPYVSRITKARRENEQNILLNIFLNVSGFEYWEIDDKFNDFHMSLWYHT
jgi:hypothetical protein